MRVTIELDETDETTSDEFVEFIRSLQEKGVLADIAPCPIDEGSEFPWRPVSASWYIEHWKVDINDAVWLVLTQLTPGELAKSIRENLGFSQDPALHTRLKEKIAAVLANAS